MRLALALLAVLLLAGCIAVDATHEVKTVAPPPTPPLFDSPEAAGKVTVLERASDLAWIAFGYENTTGMTLKRVTVRCRAFDKDGFQVDAKDTTVDGGLEGPITPGFKIRKIVVLGGIVPGDVTCSVASAVAE